MGEPVSARPPQKHFPAVAVAVALLIRSPIAHFGSGKSYLNLFLAFQGVIAILNVINASEISNIIHHESLAI